MDDSSKKSGPEQLEGGAGAAWASCLSAVLSGYLALAQTGNGAASVCGLFVGLTLVLLIATRLRQRSGELLAGVALIGTASSVLAIAPHQIAPLAGVLIAVGVTIAAGYGRDHGSASAVFWVLVAAIACGTSVTVNVNSADWGWQGSVLTYVGGAAWLGLLVIRTRGTIHRLQRELSLHDVAKAKLTRANREIEKARHQAEIANTAKSAFLANMSHELRTPLNAIIGYCEILMEEAEETGAEQLLRDLQKIRSAGTHLVSLVSGVLDLSKIEAGRMELQVEQLDLCEVIREVEDAIAPLAKKNNNELSIEYNKDDVTGPIYGDALKIRQVLLNLVSNACKFTENGTVILRVNPVDLTPSEKLVFVITDTGSGIASDQIEELFQPFTQADNSATRKHEGTGLGLALTRQFAQLMGGTVVADSELGAGSTFIVEIPRYVTDGSNHFVPAQPKFDPCDGERPIVVVDDDPAAREMVRRALERGGHAVREASDGHEALSELAQAGAALIFLDLQMPVMDGYELLEEISARPDFRSTPIVVMTGTEIDRAAERRLGPRVATIINKAEWSASQLRELVEQHALRCEPTRSNTIPTSPPPPVRIGEA